MAAVDLDAGKVYRTKELRRWSCNPTRLAEMLVRQGELTRLRHGLYYRPERSRWGTVPPGRDEILRAFFDGNPYLVTGSTAWNGLGLGSTAVFAVPLVYNTTRTGDVEIAGKKFSLRRVRFPEDPSLEWFVVDLMRNREMAGVDLAMLERNLAHAIRAKRFDQRRLSSMASVYGTREVQEAVHRSIAAAALKGAKG